MLYELTKKTFILLSFLTFICVYNISTAQKKEITVQPKQDVILKIKGTISKDNQKLKDATASLMFNGNKIKTVTSGADGQFALDLELQKDYTIIISKRGLVSQKIKVSTIVPANKVGATWWTCRVNINLFDKIDGLNTSVLDEPMSQIGYIESANDFKQDEDYAKSMKVKIDEIAGRVSDSKKEVFAKKIKDGDRSFGAKKYEEAWLCYNKAKELSPKDDKAIDKIQKTRKLIKASNDEGYAQAIEKANKFQKEKNIESAKTYFEIALLYKENDQTALNKIDDIENKGNVVAANDEGKTDNNDAGEKKLDKQDEENIIKKIDTYKKQIIVLEKENNKRSLASILDSIGNLYVKQNSLQDAVNYFSDAIKAKEEIGEKKDVAKILGKEAKLFLEMGQYDNSIQAYEKALVLNEEMKNKDEVVSILGNMANLYNYTYRTDDALRAYEKLATINAGDKGKTSDAFSNMGDIYLAKQDAEKAIDNYNKSLKLDIELKDQKGQAATYNNLGVAYHKKGEFKKSLENHDKALSLFQGLNDKAGQAKTYNNLGNNHYKMQDYPKAFEYYEKALKLTAETKDEKGEVTAYYNMGNLQKEQKNYEKALDYYSKSVEIAKRINFQDALGKNYKGISSIYYEKKEFQKAYDNYKLYVDAKFVEDSEEQLAEIQTKVSSDLEIQKLQKKLSEQGILSKLKDEKAKKEIEFRDLELQKKDAEVKKQRILIFSFIAGFLIIAVFLILIFRQYKQIKKANVLLAQKNEEIMQQKEEITSQRDKLEEVNIELEKLSIVARETSNAVMIMDGEGTMEWVNAGFVRLYGITLEQLITERGSNYIHTSSNPDVKDLFIACIEDNITVTYDTFTFNANAEKIWTQTTLTPIKGVNGKVIKLVAIDSDITQIKIAEESIKQQNEEIKAQSELLQITYKQLETKNNHILDSINYARRIQEAILPRFSLIKHVLPDSFILFKPKDVVSGDFYWFSQQGDKIFLAVVDCTGHGVPGAFMSMIGNTLLNEIIINKEIHTPSKILEELNRGISFSLTQGKEGDDTQDDGMDISICCVENNKKQITLALAGHNALMIKDDKIESIEGDVYSIGGMFTCKPGISYTDHIFEIGNTTSVYMFSDGYQDQFGGPDNKKFMASRMKKLIFENYKLEMEKQRQALDVAIEDWKTPRKQLDDILVAGLRFDPEKMK